MFAEYEFHQIQIVSIEAKLLNVLVYAQTEQVLESLWLLPSFVTFVVHSSSSSAFHQPTVQ